MAENEKLEQTKQPAPDKKSEKKAKPGIFVRAGKWLKELKVELKKVVWPTRSQTINNTLIVIACVLVVGVFIWGFDALANAVVGALIKLFS